MNVSQFIIDIKMSYNIKQNYTFNIICICNAKIKLDGLDSLLGLPAQGSFQADKITQYDAPKQPLTDFKIQ